jgi:hypothetical protein
MRTVAVIGGPIPGLPAIDSSRSNPDRSIA